MAIAVTNSATTAQRKSIDRRITRAYASVVRVKLALNARNSTNCDGARCRSRTALKAGLKVSELKAEIATEIAIVRANWLYSLPVTPGRNATGTNTAIRT